MPLSSPRLCVWLQTQEAVSAARALLEFTEQTIELPRDLICKLLSFVIDDGCFKFRASNNGPGYPGNTRIFPPGTAGNLMQVSKVSWKLFDSVWLYVKGVWHLCTESLVGNVWEWTRISVIFGLAILRGKCRLKHQRSEYVPMREHRMFYWIVVKISAGNCWKWYLLICQTLMSPLYCVVNWEVFLRWLYIKIIHIQKLCGCQHILFYNELAYHDHIF